MHAEPLGLAEQVRSLLRFRRAREDAFGHELFSDPAWDILLELFSAKLRRRSVDIESLVHIAPASVLARWVNVLMEHGLVTGSVRSACQPEVRLELTSAAAAKLGALFQTATGTSPFHGKPAHAE
jgi:hypothetical protein